MTTRTGLKVSVCVITYDQKRFIAQAIESALDQRVDFDYEIVVGDDFSTDGTRDILLRLRSAHPQRIRLLLHDRNLGFHGKFNFIRTFLSCDGEYIALLDGDDRWTSPEKLRRQVELLDARPDFAMCFHNASVRYEDGSRASHDVCPPGQRDTFTIEDLLRGNFIPACSVMYRRDVLAALSANRSWFEKLPVGDWPLHILAAASGKVAYLDAVMAEYRAHQDSYWGLKPLAERLQAKIAISSTLSRRFRGARRAIVVDSLCADYRKLLGHLEREGDRATARRVALRYQWELLRNRRRPDWEMAGDWLRISARRAYGALRALRVWRGPSA